MYVGMCMTKQKFVTVHPGLSLPGSEGAEGSDRSLLGKRLWPLGGCLSQLFECKREMRVVVVKAGFLEKGVLTSFDGGRD